MSDIFNSNIQATTTTNSAPVEQQGFGIPMYLAEPGTLDQAEAVTLYSSPEEVAIALAAGDISQSAADALDAALAQDPRVEQVALGKIQGPQGKVFEVAVGGTIATDDFFAIQLEGRAVDSFEFGYAAQAGDGIEEVVDGLIAEYAAANWSRYILEKKDASTIRITDLLKGVDPEISLAQPGSATMTSTITREAVSGADVRQIEIVTSANGMEWTLSFDGNQITYVSAPGDTGEDVAQGLMAAINAQHSDEYIAVDNDGAGSATIVIMPAAGLPEMADFALTMVGPGTSTVSVLDSATPALGDLMDALFLENSAWYAFVSEVKATSFQLELAAWAEANRRLFIGQSDNEDLPAGEAISLAAQIKAMGYGYSSVIYHADDSEEAAFCWQATTLATNPDVATTTWAYRLLRGITPNEALTDTEVENIKSAYASAYGKIRGLNATYEGKTGDGQYLDVRLTLDWLDARMAEKTTAVVVAASRRGSKIPYTDSGIQQIASAVRGHLLNDAIAAGHIVEVFNGQNVRISPVVIAPKRRNVTTTDLAARLVRIGYTCDLAGAIHQARITGYVETNLSA